MVLLGSFELNIITVNKYTKLDRALLKPPVISTICTYFSELINIKIEISSTIENHRSDLT